MNEGSGSTAQRPQYTGITNAATSIVRQNGIRGLYQGVTPNLWGAGASWGLYFLAYVITLCVLLILYSAIGQLRNLCMGTPRICNYFQNFGCVRLLNQIYLTTLLFEHTTD